MPEVLRTGPYRFYFFSHEGIEPPHVHVDRDNMSAKFWLNPVRLDSNYGFSAKELNKLLKIVLEKQDDFLEKWNGYFSVSRR